MSNFATGKHALAECPRCAQTKPYLELKEEIFNQKRTGRKVCNECFDKDHPQLQLGRLKIFDPEALKDPYPCKDEDGGALPYNPTFIP
jgi:hypothetical protein